MEESVLKAFGASITLLSGYLYLRVSPYRRFKAEHLRTDRFALHVLGFALLAYTASVVLMSVIDRRYPGTPIQSSLYKVSRGYAHVEPAVLLTLLVAPMLGIFDAVCIVVLMCRDPFVRQKEWWRPVAKARAAAIARFVFKCDDPAIRLLHRATIFRKPLLVTLKSGKVYVGQPAAGVSDPSVRAHSIKIIPLVSGYRDPETHKVELPTRYRDVYQMMVLRRKQKASNPDDPLATDPADLAIDGGSVGTDMQDIGVVVLWSEIQSLSLYDENIYKAFQSHGPAEKESSRKWFGKEGLLVRIFSSLGDD